MNDDNEYGPWITRNYASTRPSDDAVVQVKLRNGTTEGPYHARDYGWYLDGDYDIVAYRVKRTLVDTFRDAAGITGHPHADLMAEYAKDAAVNPEPWKLWQSQYSANRWDPLGDHPRWDVGTEYRRKPAEIPTEVVNGFTVPKGLTQAPEKETLYFASAPTSDVWVRNWRWACDTTDRTALDRGLAYLVEEHAVAKAKAMCGVDPQWSQP